METADRAPRPLVLTENFPPDRGGMAQSCDRITRGLRGRGIDLDIVHFTRRARHLHVERQRNGRLVRCPVDEDPSHALNHLWTGWARHAMERTHLIAFGGLLPILSAPSLAAWMDLPLLTLLRGNDFDTGIFSLRRGWALREALASSATVCAVSRDHQTRIRKLFPHVTTKLVSNGIALGDWAILESDAIRGHQLRESFGAENRRVVGVFGHLKKKKGVSLLLDAIARSNAAESLHVLLVGELDDSVMRQLEELDGKLSVTRLSFLDRWELLPCFAACDLVAIPSLYDGMPNVLLEAGALGIPVLASDAGGLGDVLRDGENGIVFQAGDIHDARRAVEAAASAPIEKLRLVAESLRDTVRSELTAEREIASYVEILRDTLRSVPSDLRPDRVTNESGETN